MATLTVTPQNLAEAITALNGRKVRKIGNNTALEVRTHSGREYVAATLHGNPIVRYTEDGVYASWAGYPTSTTRDRLNQLAAPARFNIKAFEPYINGEEVNSYREWIKVA